MEVVLILYLVYGVAFGVLSSIAAAKKNRDGVGWFLLGLLFGIFGFVASLIVEEIEPADDKSSGYRHTDYRHQTTEHRAINPKGLDTVDHTNVPVPTQVCAVPGCHEKPDSCVQCDRSHNNKEDLRVDTPKERSAGRISGQEMGKLLKAKEIVDATTDSESVANGLDWDFITGERVVDIAPYVADAVKEHGWRTDYAKYFVCINSETARPHLYDILLNSDNNKTKTRAAQILEQRGEVDFDKINAMLDMDLGARKWALRLLHIPKHTYVVDDLPKLKAIHRMLQQELFPNVAKEVEIDKWLSSNPKQVWECVCGEQNPIDEPYCSEPGCKIDPYGFRADEVRSDQTATLVGRQIELLEANLVQI